MTEQPGQPTGLPHQQLPQYPPGAYPAGQYPPGYQQPYGAVNFTTVKQRAFNPVTFGIHLCLWIFLHSWLTVLTVGLWLLVAIPVTFLGWRVKRTIPVQQPPGPYPQR